MSKHECRISGVITLKADVTEVQIKEALTDFLVAADRDFDDEVADGNIEVESTNLALELNFYGDGGGYDDHNILALVESLSLICEGPNWFEVLDFDTGDTNATRWPEFIGTERDRRMASIRYGIEQMRQWVEPLIGTAAFQSYAEQITNTPTVPAYAV